MESSGRSRRHRGVHPVVALALVAMVAGSLLAPGGAVADVLVTKGGDSVRTRGPWKVDGGLVVFERPNGTLASMRLSEVDLEASERATAEAKARTERARTASEEDEEAEKGEPRREPVARLTDKDLPPVGRSEGSSEAASDPASDTTGPGGEDEAQGLEIVEWAEDESFGEDGLSFVGRIRNASDHTAVGIRVTGTLLDEQGDERDSATAILTSDTLQAGQSADFRADFPGTFSYADAEFAVDGDLLLDEPPPRTEEEAEGGSGESESAEEQGSEG